MIGDQILQSYVSQFVKEHDLGGLTPEEQFERFCNYTVLSRLYCGTINTEALATDKAYGIDGIAIIANDNPVTSIAEVEAVAPRTLDAGFVFLQTKRSSSIDSGDVLKFFDAVKDFFTEIPTSRPSARMQELRALRRSVFDLSIRMEGPPYCELYFIYTGKWKDDHALKTRFDSCSNDLAGACGLGDVRFIPVDLEKLKSYYRSIKQRVVKKFTFPRRVALPHVNDVDQAFIGIAPAIEFLKLITDADGNLERGLFYENVRDYLGDNAVNADIARTATEISNHDKFALLNNGVTIVAGSVTAVGDDVTLRDYQIVNGCQTSHALFYHQDSVGPSLQIPLKVISSTNQELIGRVIKATNWQTSVTLDAFIALEPFQKRLEEFYSSVPNAERRLFYERRSKQYEALDTPKLRVITIPVQIQCVVSMFLGEPQSTHRYYGELLRSNSSQIFQDTHDPEAYYLAAYGIFLIYQEFREGRIQQQMKPFRYHLLYLIGVLVGGDTGAAALRSGDRRGEAILRGLRDLMADVEEFRIRLAFAAGLIREALASGNFAQEADRRREFTAAIKALALRGQESAKSAPAARSELNAGTPHRQLRPVSGVVKRVGAEFGFIKANSGPDVFFHCSEWRGDTSPAVGEAVAFRVVFGRRGLKALDVSPAGR